MRAKTDQTKVAEVAYSAGAGNQYHEHIEYEQLNTSSGNVIYSQLGLVRYTR